ncbi:hypothetical protein [Sphingobium sp. SCG-1]|uniref:hypothetical protein n=1 Tax=Sphingobium sp. SCG-1 TaxID=2072936 RepID=UPI0016705CE1|nr:hypothetical protein [Sphingobium sp. SCG-1]
MPERIVSIGLLTESDLRRLGNSFTRHYPIIDDDQFDELLAKLDRLPATEGPHASKAPGK